MRTPPVKPNRLIGVVAVVAKVSVYFEVGPEVGIQEDPPQILRAEEEVSYQNSPTLFPAEPAGEELGAVAPTSAGPTLMALFVESL
jgi:hypothetical protein